MQSIEEDMKEASEKLTAEQIDEVRNLMDKNFSYYTVGDDANNKDNWYWNGKVTEENMGKQISGLTVFGKYGNSIVSQAYTHHFDSTVDGLYAFMNGIDIGTVDLKVTSLFSLGRFKDLYNAKSDFYNIAGALFESEDTEISGEYGHLKDQSTLQNNVFYFSTQNAGLFGNTGNKTTGAHLHYSVYTKENIAYSDTSMKILFGKNYQTGSMYNGSWRTVYNPTSFYERYR